MFSKRFLIIYLLAGIFICGIALSIWKENEQNFEEARARARTLEGGAAPGKVPVRGGYVYVKDPWTDSIDRVPVARYEEAGAEIYGGFVGATNAEIALFQIDQEEEESGKVSAGLALAWGIGIPVIYLIGILVLLGRGGVEGNLYGKGASGVVTGGLQVFFWPLIVLFGQGVGPSRSSSSTSPQSLAPAPVKGVSDTKPTVENEKPSESPPARLEEKVIFKPLPPDENPLCFYCGGGKAIANYREQPICPECIESIRSQV